jgi:hypothetical protein
MTDNNIKGTYYIISDASVTKPEADYMTATQVKALYTAGNEIGSHSIDHCDLANGTTEPAGPACPGFNLDAEMHTSQTVLEGVVGAGNVTNFAYPYGSYNDTTIAAGLKYYKSQRTVSAGYNTLDSFDATKLKMFEVDSNITQAQVKSWIDGAIAQKSWLILCYHEIADTPVDPTDALYTTKPADFAAEMAYLNSKRAQTDILTVAQALAKAQTQIGVVLPPAVKPGDTNNDTIVNVTDLDPVLRNWGKAGMTRTQGNLSTNTDPAHVIDVSDLDAVLRNWSK